MRQPLSWSVTVKDQDNHLLYAVQRNDAWLDEFFRDAGYVDGCQSYEACKRRYYFDELPTHVSEPGHCAFHTRQFKLNHRWCG